MRVALDVHALQVEGWADRGVGRYITGYSAALGRRGALAAALLAPELPPASGLPAELVGAGLVRWDGASTCRDLLRAAEPVVYHPTAPFLHTEPGAPPALGVAEHWAAAPAPRVVLLHDLIPLRAPRHYLHAAGHEERYRARAEWVAAADLVVTNSDYTAGEAVTLLGCDPARVATIGVGVSSYFSPADGTDEQLWRHHFPRLVGRPHLVTVGGSDVRKGTDRAIVALSLLVARGFDLSLLVLGHLTPNWAEELARTAAACGVADRVCFGGAVDDELLRACYRRALISIMPSLAEGAGLPVLESAACGTPALASSTTALAETAATPAALFDPTDPDSMAEVIAAAVDCAGRRAAILAAQQAVARTSTWDTVAARAVRAIEAVVTGGSPLPPAAGPGAARPMPSRRLALVGWPAGEEDLLAEVAAAWGGAAVGGAGVGGAGVGGAAVGGAAVGGVTDIVASSAVGPPPGGRTIAPAAFGPDVRPASYDGVVYVLTGAPADEWVLALARRHPGWLWVRGGATGPGAEGPGAEVLGAEVLGALEPLVRRSRGVVVGSEAARELVRLSLRPLAAEPPVVLVPEAPAGLAGLVAAGLVAAGLVAVVGGG